jgi:hypothetical protein
MPDTRHVRVVIGCACIAVAGMGQNIRMRLQETPSMTGRIVWLTAAQGGRLSGWYRWMMSVFGCFPAPW